MNRFTWKYIAAKNYVIKWAADLYAKKYDLPQQGEIHGPTGDLHFGSWRISRIDGISSGFVARGEDFGMTDPGWKASTRHPPRKIIAYAKHDAGIYQDNILRYVAEAIQRAHQNIRPRWFGRIIYHLRDEQPYLNLCAYQAQLSLSIAIAKHSRTRSPECWRKFNGTEPPLGQGRVVIKDGVVTREQQPKDPIN